MILTLLKKSVEKLALKNLTQEICWCNSNIVAGKPSESRNFSTQYFDLFLQTTP